eukprot:1007144-Rhodomonas_salina.1
MAEFTWQTLLLPPPRLPTAHKQRPETPRIKDQKTHSQDVWTSRHRHAPSVAAMLMTCSIRTGHRTANAQPEHPTLYLFRTSLYAMSVSDIAEQPLTQICYASTPRNPRQETAFL